MKSSPTETLARTRAPRGPCSNASAAVRASIGAATCSILAEADTWCSKVPSASARASVPAAAVGLITSLDINAILLCARQLTRTSDLLVVGCNRGDLLIVELLGKEHHGFGIVSAESPLPHSELKRDVARVLSGEVGKGRGPTCAFSAMAVVAAGNSFRCVARLSELLAPLDEVRVRIRQRWEWSLEACIIASHVGDVLRRERASDRCHDCIRAHARSVCS